jgi:hypothetical protein
MVNVLVARAQNVVVASTRIQAVINRDGFTEVGGSQRCCRQEGGQRYRGASLQWRSPSVCLTVRASAAATSSFGHYPTFLGTEATASCMRLLGGRGPRDPYVHLHRFFSLELLV